MQAVIVDAPFQMKVGPWQTPEPSKGEVFISTRAVGICAGDFYFYVGKNPYARYPQVCGHEIAGQIEGVGEGVEGFKSGDRVVVEPFIACGSCYPCSIGKPNCCRRLEIIGVHRPGGFAEYLVAPAANVHKTPPELPLRDAAFAEPVAIGVHACRRGSLKAGELVVVMGCGPIGLAIIDVARALGAKVVATDILPERIEAASKLGVKTLPSSGQLYGAVVEETGSEGAPVVIEATGNPKAIEQALDLVAAGGRIIVVGLIAQGIGVTLPGLDLTRKEVTILGSRASSNCFPESLNLLAQGKVSYPRLATEFNLWDGPRIFADMAANPRTFLKGVLLL